MKTAVYLRIPCLGESPRKRQINLGVKWFALIQLDWNLETTNLAALAGPLIVLNGGVAAVKATPLTRPAPG